MSRRVGVIAGLAVALVGATSGVAAAANLSHDYQFQGSYSPSTAGTAQVAPVGSGHVFATELVGGCEAVVLRFPLGSGVGLDRLLFSSSYSVVMLIRLEDVAGYNKVFDPTGGQADRGLYVRDGRLDWFEASTNLEGQAVLANNAYAEIAFTYTAGQVAGYVNGVRQFSGAGQGFVDPSLSNPRFFVDDNLQGTEESGGAVSRIRIYQGALTDAEVAAIFGGAVRPPVPGHCPQPPPPPGVLETTITKHPKNRTRKRRAVFEFISSIEGATFECRLDKKPFDRCSSPHKLRVKPGRHRFAVRSTVGGVTDASPDTDRWRVKKRRR